MVTYSLPAIAPAAWPAWCIDFLPFCNLILSSQKTGCDFIALIISEADEIIRLSVLMANSVIPPPASQEEQFCFAFWNDFMKEAAGVLAGLACKTINNVSLYNQWQIFDEGGQCSGPPTPQYLNCWTFTNGINVGAILTHAVGVISTAQATKDIEGLKAAIEAICIPSTPFDDFVQCCKNVNENIQDRINKIKTGV